MSVVEWQPVIAALIAALVILIPLVTAYLKGLLTKHTEAVVTAIKTNPPPPAA